MSFRSDIREALDAVTPPAPHLAHVVVDAARRGDRPRRPDRGRMVPIAALVLVLGVGVGIALAAQPALTSRSPASPGPSSGPGGLTLSRDLAVTTWVPDPSVTGGPWPGFRPQLVAIDHRNVTSARVVRSGGSWTVVLTLDTWGARTLLPVTAAAVAACPRSDCAQRHLTIWVGLTSTEIDRWAGESSTLYRPVAEGGSLLADPQVLQPISDGELSISGDLTQRQAEDLARWLTAIGSAAKTP